MRNRKPQDLEKLLKDRLSGKAAAVPDFVWENIEKELFPKKKRRFFWLFFFGSGLLAGLAFLCLFSANSGKRNVQEMKNEPGVYSASASESESEKEFAIRSVSEDQPRFRETGFPGSKKRGRSEVREKVHPASRSIHGKVRSSGRFLSQNTQPGTYGPKTGSRVASPVQKTRSAANIHGEKTPGTAKTVEKNGQNAFSDQVTAKSTSSVEHTGNTAIPGTDKTALAASDQLPPKDSIALTDSAALEKTETAFIPDTVTNLAPTPDPEKPGGKKSTRFAVSMYGGATMYDIAVFKDYFTSGQLSNRPFKSGGFEAGAGFSYRISPKIGVYTQVSFNRKNTSFNYNLAVTQSDYFHLYSVGEAIPLEHIEDDGATSCFLVKDVIADYRIDSWIFSLGTTYRILEWKKFALGADLRFSGNLNSRLQLNELTVIQVQQPDNERFNYFRIGGGLTLDYHITGNLSLGIAPVFHWQFNPDKQSFYKGKLKELVLPLNVAFHF